MENVTAMIKSVCIISAAICIAESLIEGMKLKNQVSFLLNLIFMLVISAPLIQGTFEFELPDISKYELSDYSEAENVYNEELLRTTEENISSVLKSQVEAAGIICSEIKTSVNISETNSILISSVTICTDNFEAAEEIIKNSLGTDTEVYDGNTQ